MVTFLTKRLLMKARQLRSKIPFRMNLVAAQSMLCNRRKRLLNKNWSKDVPSLLISKVTTAPVVKSSLVRQVTSSCTERTPKNKSQFSALALVDQICLISSSKTLTQQSKWGKLLRSHRQQETSAVPSLFRQSLGSNLGYHRRASKARTLQTSGSPSLRTLRS